MPFSFLRKLFFFVLSFYLLCNSTAVYALQKNIPIGIYTKEGTSLLQLRVDTPETHKEKQKGLMFRRILPEHAGMLFLYKEPTPVNIWMKNTFIPLDILFLDKEGKIFFIVENAVPFDERAQGPSEKSQAFLEVPAGTVKSYNITIGDIVSPLPFNLVKE